MRVLAVVLLLAGCLGPPGADGDDPPWTHAEAAPWFTWTTGCSACGFQSSQHPQAQTLVVYRDGGLLWFDFGLQSRGGNTSFEPGLGPWSEEIAVVRSVQHDGWHDETIHVFSVDVAFADGWSETEATLAAEHDRLRAPPPPPADCADCSGEWVEAIDPHIHARLRGNYDEDNPWGTVLAQMRQLHMQVRG